MLAHCFTAVAALYVNKGMEYILKCCLCSVLSLEGFLKVIIFPLMYLHEVRKMIVYWGTIAWRYTQSISKYLYCFYVAEVVDATECPEIPHTDSRPSAHDVSCIKLLFFWWDVSWESLHVETICRYEIH